MSVWTQEFLFYSIAYNSSLSFNAPVLPDLDSRRSLKLPSVSFSHVPSLFEHFLTFWQNRVFLAHLVPCLPTPEVCYFSKKSSFLLVESVIWKLRFGRALCSGLLESYCYQAFSMWAAGDAQTSLYTSVSHWVHVASSPTQQGSLHSTFFFSIFLSPLPSVRTLSPIILRIFTCLVTCDVANFLILPKCFCCPLWNCPCVGHRYWLALKWCPSPSDAVLIITSCHWASPDSSLQHFSCRLSLSILFLMVMEIILMNLHSVWRQIFVMYVYAICEYKLIYNTCPYMYIYTYIWTHIYLYMNIYIILNQERAFNFAKYFLFIEMVR